MLFDSNHIRSPFSILAQYFTDRFDDYWHINYPLIDIALREKNKMLYFWDVSRKATDYKGPFTAEGIYLFKGYDGKYHLHALEIGNYALGCWAAWLKYGSDKWLKEALLHCDWLIKSMEPNGSLKIEHINPIYNDLPRPWTSALAQGLAISSLVRAYRFGGKKKYLKYARFAADYLNIPIESGGVLRKLQKGFILEEYPQVNTSGVLNGYISAILGIYELGEIDVFYFRKAKKHIKNLTNILPLYNAGYWSYYDLNQTQASAFYHRYHIKQLETLHRVFGNSIFLEYADMFTVQIKKINNSLRALKDKIIWRFTK